MCSAIPRRICRIRHVACDRPALLERGFVGTPPVAPKGSRRSHGVPRLPGASHLAFTRSRASNGDRSSLPVAPLSVHRVRPASPLAHVKDEQAPGVGAADVHVRRRLLESLFDGSLTGAPSRTSLHSTTNRRSPPSSPSQMTSGSTRQRPSAYFRSIWPRLFTTQCRSACNTSWGPASLYRARPIQCLKFCRKKSWKASSSLSRSRPPGRVDVPCHALLRHLVLEHRGEHAGLHLAVDGVRDAQRRLRHNQPEVAHTRRRRRNALRRHGSERFDHSPHPGLAQLVGQLI